MPNDDSTQIDLRQVATVTLSHLDRLAHPYIASEKVRDIVHTPHSIWSTPCILLQLQLDAVDQQRISKVFHWGGGSSKGSHALTKPNISTILLDMGAKQIVSSEKHRLVLTVHGSVYWLKDSGDLTPEPQVNYM